MTCGNTVGLLERSKMNRKIVVVLIFSVFIVIGGIIYAKGHAADSGKDDAASVSSSVREKLLRITWMLHDGKCRKWRQSG